MNGKMGRKETLYNALYIFRMDRKGTHVGSSTIGSFPSEICILVLDDNLTCSNMVKKMLQTRKHEVFHFKTITNAFNAIREREDRLDLILTSVYVPNSMGLDFLKHVWKEVIIPIILMSTNEKVKTLFGGLESGTTLYLVKDVSVNDIENLRKYLFTMNKCEGETIELECSAQRASLPKNVFSKPVIGEISQVYRTSYSKEPNQTSVQEGVGEFTTQKKPRVVWTESMHDKFLEAIEKLGLENACPSKILEHMNIPGLTRYNIASHLQKHRNHLKQVQDGKHTRSKYRLNLTNNVKCTCFSSDHSSQNFSLSDVEPQIRERLAQIEQEFSGTYSMPTFDAACCLNSEAAICVSVSSLGHGQSLPLSNQGPLQLPFPSQAPSPYVKNNMCHSGTGYGQNSTDWGSAELELIHFHNGNKLQNYSSKSSYIGLQLADNGKLVAGNIERNVALPMTMESPNHYPSTYINPIPQQQHSLPQNLVQQEPESSSDDINIDDLWNSVSINMDLYLQDSLDESILDGAVGVG